MIKPNDNINLINRFNLTGHRALVTGSSRGIGRAIAIALAEFGAQVILHGVKESSSLNESLLAVKKFSPSSFSVVGDLSDPLASEKILGDISKQSKLPDILIANASLQFKTKWNEIKIQEAQQQMQVNLFSTLSLIQGCFSVMKDQNWGRIVTIGSVQEFRPHPDMAIYAASKSAQENLVRNLAKQISQYGITVNNISPGVFATDRNEEALSNEEYLKKVLDAIPSHTFAEPSDAAGTALLLCSDAGRYITGANITIDGGLKLP